MREGRVSMQHFITSSTTSSSSSSWGGREGVVARGPSCWRHLAPPPDGNCGVMFPPHAHAGKFIGGKVTRGLKACSLITSVQIEEL